MTTDQILDVILDREQEGTPPYLSKDDAGGRTSWGISERAHPAEWQPGPPTKARARVLYTEQYVKPFDILITGEIDDRIRVALIDDAVMSGVISAKKRFQYVLGVSLDGVLGSKTLARARILAPDYLLKQYVIERAIRITRLVERRPSDLTNLTGWITRILSFLP